ncbi:ABC transporter ATP-binding protein [Microvirga alba]|uniref:ABC transporter ATP-binding protein n=1 Tax=Microvirga alba TaxID=2791025 RepID=A0A931BPZ9_9HYPH|nr:ABC transporter ATP-binding protein [Microvirga alba]MBF9233923.1 ABC transporter ATP-binding protein [Microvirga alba]
MTEPFLEVRDLNVRFRDESGFASVPALDDISFVVGAERVALVGESGSGKSTAARAVMGLLPPSAKVAAKNLRFGPADLLSLDHAGWNALRGSGMGFVLQDPRFSLNPSRRIGWQVEEALRLHTRLTRKERRERALDMLSAVGLPSPLRIYESFPGELSGGMGQRVMIAAMMINRPKLLIADEPTSALDRDLRDQILDLMGRLTAEQGAGLLLISHDLQQVTRFADRVLVLYRGKIVDERRGHELSHSDHPYTRTLWAARPSAATYGTRLPVLRRDLGTMP